MEAGIVIRPDKADLIVKCICLLHYILIQMEGISNALEATHNHPPSLNNLTGRFNRGTNEIHEIRTIFIVYFNSVRKSDQSNNYQHE